MKLVAGRCHATLQHWKLLPGVPLFSPLPADQVQRTTNAVSSKYSLWWMHSGSLYSCLENEPPLCSNVKGKDKACFPSLLLSPAWSGYGIGDITVLSRAHPGWNKGRIKSLPSLALAFPQDVHSLLPEERANPQWQLLWFPESTELGLPYPSRISHGCPSKRVCACLEADRANSLESDWEEKCMDS